MEDVNGGEKVEDDGKKEGEKREEKRGRIGNALVKWWKRTKGE